jgi:hypothetical protein
MLFDLNAFQSWSGWAISVIQFPFWIAALRRERRNAHIERCKNERMARLVAQTSQAPPGSHRMVDERYRALLIEVAAGGQPFSAALSRGQKAGADTHELESLALGLRSAGLLRFSDPLTAQTTLTLNF